MHAALDATPLILSSGGLARYTSELALALAREFPEDTYTLLSSQPFQMPSGSPSNLLAGMPPMSVAARRWWLFGLPGRLRKCGIQLFHGTNFEVPYRGATPAVMTIHDLSPWKDPAWHDGADRVRIRMPILLRLGRARHVITVSEAIRREVISRFSLRPERVHAIPLAAAAWFQPTPAAPVHNKPFFLFAGTIEPRKNVTGLIEAWQRSKTQTQADLILAGRFRADAPDLSATDGLSFAGEVTEHQLAVLYTQALAFVYPSFYEGFGLPIVEAMQCGCPVIASNDPALLEVSGGAALHAGSTEELAECLRRVATDNTQVQRLREASLARANAFSWRKTARATHRVYETAVVR